MSGPSIITRWAHHHLSPPPHPARRGGAKEERGGNYRADRRVGIAVVAGEVGLHFMTA